MSESRSIHLLLVESQEEHARRVLGILRAARSQQLRWERVRHLQDAQQHLEAGRVDVTLLDLSLPDQEGMAVLHEAQRVAPNIPLIVLSTQANHDFATQAPQHGAQDFLLKGELTSERLVRAVNYAVARHRSQAALRSLSLIDELTGLYNRRGFIALAKQQLKLSARHGLHSSLVFVDVDGLKIINDTFGHSEGDQALQAAAALFRECCLRDSDIVARLGGDEFCALLTDTTPLGELVIRQRISQLFAEHNAQRGRRYELSVSVGVVATEGSLELDDQVAKADLQMYDHKREKHRCGLNIDGHAEPSSV